MKRLSSHSLKLDLKQEFVVRTTIKVGGRYHHAPVNFSTSSMLRA